MHKRKTWNYSMDSEVMKSGLLRLRQVNEGTVKWPVAADLTRGLVVVPN